MTLFFLSLIVLCVVDLDGVAVVFDMLVIFVRTRDVLSVVVTVCKGELHVVVVGIVDFLVVDIVILDDIVDVNSPAAVLKSVFKCRYKSFHRFV